MQLMLRTGARSMVGAGGHDDLNRIQNLSGP